MYKNKANYHIMYAGNKLTEKFSMELNTQYYCVINPPTSMYNINPVNVCNSEYSLF